MLNCMQLRKNKVMNGQMIRHSYKLLTSHTDQAEVQKAGLSAEHSMG